MSRPLAGPVRRVRRRVGLTAARAVARTRRADVAVFHEFVPPPYGGGNQFLLALVGELGRRGLVVARNEIPPRTRACLFNSFNFDFDRLRAFHRDDCRMVHRVDGPIAVYRGFDDSTDARIAAVNDELAEATVFQSEWSLRRHRDLGIELRDPHVIRNTVDERIFNADGRLRYDGTRPLRVIAASWSDNERKGGAVYAWLDEQLDRSRFELTFVGRTKHPLPVGRTLPPQPSAELAALLREHDLFLTASLDDPCSNAVLEALACGLPVVYARSGGHPELVGDAGFGFDDRTEIPALLEEAAARHDELRSAISIPSLAEVADAYLAVLGAGTDAGA